MGRPSEERHKKYSTDEWTHTYEKSVFGEREEKKSHTHTHTEGIA